MKSISESRTIEELSQSDLGKLFPIRIVAPDPSWPIAFERERQLLRVTLGPDTTRRIEHFGSTAVPNLAAKPTIDILVELVEALDIKESVIDKMKSIGYHYILRTDCGEAYLHFVKGYHLEGMNPLCYHVHMAPVNHPLWQRLRFRDYLIAHPSVAQQYADLKYELASKFTNDREGYTNAKAEFVGSVMEMLGQSVFEHPIIDGT